MDEVAFEAPPAPRYLMTLVVLYTCEAIIRASCPCAEKYSCACSVSRVQVHAGGCLPLDQTVSRFREDAECCQPMSFTSIPLDISHIPQAYSRRNGKRSFQQHCLRDTSNRSVMRQQTFDPRLTSDVKHWLCRRLCAIHLAMMGRESRARLTRPIPAYHLGRHGDR